MKTFTFFIFLTFVLQLAITFPSAAQNKWMSNFQTSLDTAQQIWVARYAGAGGPYDDIANAIVADDSGNVYITGGSADAQSNNEVTTIKYNAAGQEVWNNQYLPLLGTGFGRAIAIDNQGNIIVTGQYKTTNSTTGSDYITIKYSPSGEQLWATAYNGTGNSDDNAKHITLDNSGNIFIAGESAGNGSQNDIVTVKYNTSGVQQWVARYNGPGNGQEFEDGIALDGAGNVYVAGVTTASAGNYDFVTIKYNPSGQQQWASTYNGPGNSYDGIWSLAVDDSGNAYVVGRSTGSGTGQDYATMKYNTLGAVVWLARYNGPGNSNDQPYSIAIGDSGSVYVTGTSPGSGTNNDIATLKYDKNGVQQWVTRYNGPNNNYDAGYALTIDASRNVYVTGTSNNAGSSYDYCTIKYNTNGVQQWVVSYDGGVAYYDYGLAIALDHSNNVYVTGQSWGSGTHYDFATVRYQMIQLTPAAPANLSAVADTQFIRLNWNDNSNNELGFKIERKDTSNAPWTLIDSVGADITTYKNTGLTPGKSYFYRIYAYNSFGNSDYSNIVTVDTYLPVELTSFSAYYSEQGARLTWTTATEINNLGFEIERCQKSEQKTDWESVGFVNGAGTSALKNSYSFLDNKVSAGIYIYRLKQVDFDGSYKYSGLIEVNTGNPKGFALEQNYPNPFNPSTRISYVLPEASFVTIRIFDLLGRELETIVNEVKQAGRYEIDYSAASLSAGMYIYKMEAKGYVSAHKMLVLK